jgi:hypothetical protein
VSPDEAWFPGSKGGARLHEGESRVLRA